MSEENKCTKRLKCPMTPDKSSVGFGLEASRPCFYSTAHLPKLFVLCSLGHCLPLQKMIALDEMISKCLLI